MQIEDDRIRLSGSGLFQAGMHVVPSVSYKTNNKLKTHQEPLRIVLLNKYFIWLFAVSCFDHHIFGHPSTNTIIIPYKTFSKYLQIHESSYYVLNQKNLEIVGYKHRY